MTQTAGDGRYVTLGTTQTISGAKTFSNHIFIRGSESNDIFTVFNPSGSIKTNNSGGGNLTAIVHALSFKWYDSDWQIGNIRSDTVESKGFGITKGNSNLVFRVDDTNGWLNGYPILTSNNYASYIGNSFVKKTGDTMTGGLRIAEGTASDMKGILTSDGTHALLAHIGNDSYVARRAGTTRIRSGETNLLHRRNETDYIIWDSFNDGSGSGLDADLLDGIDSGGFRRRYNLGRTQDSRVSYIVLALAYDGTLLNGSYFNGSVFFNRGDVGAWNAKTTVFVNCGGQYNNNVSNYFQLGSSIGISGLYLITYNGTRYISIRVNSTSSQKVFIEAETSLTPFIANEASVSNPVLLNATPYIYTSVDSANRLTTARTINGTAFNGTSNIVTSYWGTARTLSLTGNATGSVSMNGSSNVSMSVNVNYATSAGNADTLDGYHEWNFFRENLSTIADETITNIPANRSGSYTLTHSGWNGAAFVLHASTSNSNVGFLVPGSQYANVKLITCIDSRQSSWRDNGYIITATNIGSYNAGSATQLQTARTIWGQSFNGTANVSGNMTGVGSITASGSVAANGFYINNNRGRFFYDGPSNAVWLQGGSGIALNISNLNTAWIPTMTVYASATHFLGGVYSDSYVSALGQNSSDARLKINIQDFKATSLIKQLHPKSFEWNNLAKSKFEVFRNTGTQYGLIAQDVKRVMPEWVDDNLIGSGYMGIRYDKLIPVLLQGEIETIGRVETLEDKVKRLEMENSKLKAKLSKLERRIR